MSSLLKEWASHIAFISMNARATCARTLADRRFPAGLKPSGEALSYSDDPALVFRFGDREVAILFRAKMLAVGHPYRMPDGSKPLRFSRDGVWTTTAGLGDRLAAFPPDARAALLAALAVPAPAEA